MFLFVNTKISLIKSSAKNLKTCWDKPNAAEKHFEVSDI